MKRRQFIQVTATGAAALATGGAAWLPISAEAQTVFADPELLGFFPAERVIRIGRTYREAVRHENGIPALKAAIASDVAKASGEPTTTLRRQVSDLIRTDFAEGRTVQIDGWILALTEARQCALYSLARA